MNTLPGFPVPTDYHDFEQRLSYADHNSGALQLEVFYTAAFPHIERLEKVSELNLQKQGIDTIAILENGKQIFFDEKIRSKEYPDILIEEFSVWPGYPFANGQEIGPNEYPKNWRKLGLKPGWISGQKKTDYITYIIKPSRAAYFIPFLLLQRAWLKHYMGWLRIYGRKAAKNQTYYTTNIPVPTRVLFESLYEQEQWNNCGGKETMT